MSSELLPGDGPLQSRTWDLDRREGLLVQDCLLYTSDAADE